MVAGTPPIRATKARYFEDARFMERILTLPDPVADPVAANPSSDDWSSRIVAATKAAAPATAGGTEGDPANAGIRREPELPEQEEIAPPERAPLCEVDVLDDDPDVESIRASRLRQQVTSNARQATMDPADGLEL